jgi:hypothetical protein
LVLYLEKAYEPNSWSYTWGRKTIEDLPSRLYPLAKKVCKIPIHFLST